ncbi:unnamed protein product [Cuscuta epithymum]|uniref:Integrase catalytic domain-containing protein n=1 Tax=Cuscuta epithymum TaxID=186058 RepID=A0AAV0DEC4_9ASTE|nr:unnamed protein product [Cuscuta epithymum]
MAVSEEGDSTGRSKLLAKTHAAVAESNFPQESAAENKSAGTPLPGFSLEQWKALISAFPRSSLSRMAGNSGNGTWILDTGATNHICGDLNLLSQIQNIAPCSVGLPDGKTVLATKEGCVKFSNGLCLQNVLFVPQMQCHLISVTQLNDTLDCFVQFSSDLCVIQDRVSRKLIGTGERRNGLYYLRESTTVHALTIDGNKHSALDLWHKRMGHPSGNVMRWLAPVSNLRGSFSSSCEICFRAKQHRDSFPASSNKTHDIFELVHCDLWGPYNTPSSCGAKLFLTIVDDHSRAVWINLLMDKTEVFKMFISFVAMVERQFSKKVRVVRSDNGTEFNCLKSFFQTSGIVFQTSCVGTPQQNGRVERKHQHILNVARALRF